MYTEYKPWHIQKQKTYFDTKNSLKNAHTDVKNKCNLQTIRKQKSNEIYFFYLVVL